MKNNISNLLTFYQEYNIYKCLLIVQDDEEVLEMDTQLKNNDILCSIILEEDCNDEHNKYLTKLRYFNESLFRVIIMNYQSWYIIKKDVEAYILPEQNLIALSNIGDDGRICIKKWYKDAGMRGFIETYRENYFINLDNNN